MIFVFRMISGSGYSSGSYTLKEYQLPLAWTAISPAATTERPVVFDEGHSTKSQMTIEEWLENALRDAERRELPALRPLLESLAKSTIALRSADWNLDLSGELPETPPEHVR